MNPFEPTPPTLLPPSIGGPQKSDPHRLSLRIAVAGLVVAVIGIFIGFLNWVLPFAAVGPSPVPNPFVTPTPATDPVPPQPTPSATPVPPAPPPVIPVTVPPGPPSRTSPTSPRRKGSKPLPPMASAPPEQSTEMEQTPLPQPQIDLNPTPDPDPVPTPVDTPEVSVGDVIVVTAEPPKEPRGPRPRAQLYYPPIPAADAVRSHLSGGVIACQVTVGQNGQARAICNSNLEKLAPFFLRRAEAVLEQAEWEPASNENGTPCEGVATVRFRMN